MIEHLEPRQLLTATVGFETQVNTFVSSFQDNPAVAIDAAGDHVIVWESSGQDGNLGGIYAQRYNSAGIAQGAEFRVNTSTADTQQLPSVAMDSAGDFVVTWASVQDGSGYGVYAQRYNASGVAQGAEFRVNTYTTNEQLNPNVAMDSTGNFVITWQSFMEDGDNWGVYAQRFSKTGAATGSEFRVNTYTTNSQFFPDVAMDGAGNFVVVWDGQNGSDRDIYAQRYNAAGVAQGTEFPVNTYTTGTQALPSVAMNSTGSFVVAWESAAQDGSGYGIYAQRFNAAGAIQGTEFRGNTFTAGDQTTPSVAIDTAGEFVLTWSDSFQDGSQTGVYGQQFTSTGAASGTEFRVNTFTVGSQTNSDVAMNGEGDFVITWDSLQDSSATGIYSQRYKQTPVGPIVTAVFDGSTLISPNLRLSTPVNQILVEFSEAMETTGGSTGAHGVLNPDNWRLLRNGVIQHNGLTVLSFGYNLNTNRFAAAISLSTPLDEGAYQLVAYPSIRSASGQPLDGDDNGVSGGNFTRSFLVGRPLPNGAETKVNTYTTNSQSDPDVAADAAGNYVVVWSSFGQDGNGSGVYGQRYNAGGSRLGGEFRVNTVTLGVQDSPSVAMDSTGDFVVVWRGQDDTNSSGIFGQRFNASGVAQAGNFLVNTYTTSVQANAQVAIDSIGEFVIAWQSLNQAGASSSYDVYVRRYNAAGVPLGAEFLCNAYTINNQQHPAIAMDPRGDFVLAWETYDQTYESHYDVYVQRFNAQGLPVGNAFTVNTDLGVDQTHASVAMDPTGNFVVTWESNNAYETNSDLFVQVFGSDGGERTSEFLVNLYRDGRQTFSDVAMDSAGEFVVAWTSDQQDGSGRGIYSQRFNLDGVRSNSIEFLVNTTTASEQLSPAVAMDQTGDAVVVWQSLNQDGSGYGIYSQRYKSDVSPILSGVEPALLVAAAQLKTPISSTLFASDPDNTTWIGATVQITSNYLPNQDVLGFVNQLGITGAFNAATGILTLTGTTSVSNYRTALRSVTYHNSSATPNVSLTRTVSFVANDGLQDSDAVTRDVTVTTAGAAVLSGVSGTVTYSENAALLVIAPALVIADASTNLLASATVSFTNWQAEDRVQFNNIFALQHSFSQNLTAHTASLTITGVDTVDHYQALLRSVQYWDVSNNPVTTTRIASFTVSDGALTSNAVTRNINVTAVNDPPALSAIETVPLVYQANNPAFPGQPISATLLVGDPDSTNLSGASIQITAGYQNAANDHDLLSFTNKLGITGSFNATTGKMTLTGTTSVSNYRTAIRSVLFSSSGSAVSSVARTLTITVTDDFSPTHATSAAVTRSVTVITTNSPPAVTGVPATALSYLRGAAASALAPALLVFDGDGINLASATIQVTSNYQNGQDVLAFTPGFGVTGSFNAANGKLTLTGATSLANYQTLLRSVTFKTNTSAASISARAITFIVNDGLASSSAVSRTVTLT